MKNTRKFAAMIAALTLSVCSIAPMISSAATASAGHTLTITSYDNANHTYEAYQIFSGTYNNGSLTDIQWGDGVKSANLIADLKNDATLGTLFENCTSAQDVADVLSSEDVDTGEKVFTHDSNLSQAFAKVVGRNLTDVTSGTYSNGTITGLADGYYLGQDASNPTIADNGANSGAKTRFVIGVVGTDMEIISKSSAPTVVKKVKENSDTGSDYEWTHGEGTTVIDEDYNDVADYNIGDDVPFKLYGTLPSTYDDYEHYYYQFTDNLGGEFTLAEGTEFNISVNGERKITLTLGQNGKAYDSSLGTDIFIEHHGSLGGNNEHSLGITIEDIKKLAPNATDVITVEYVAKLNDKAVIGLDGQINGVTLKYSNNPNIEYVPKTGDEDDNDKENPESPGDEETGSTPWDGVIVFTYGVDIDKVKEDNTTKLAGAKFAIYKQVPLNESSATSGPIEDDTTLYKKVYLAVDANGEVKELNEAPTKDTVVGSANGVWESNGTDNIEIKGLDAGTYYITELSAPAGYNKLSEDITFVISPTITNGEAENRQSWIYSTDKSTAKDALTGLDIKYGNVSDTELGNDAVGVTAESGKGTITIVNKKGSELPSTGGIGTTIFYLGGGCMVAVAGIFLITKKRMGKEEN